jgi:hypothetical protein
MLRFALHSIQKYIETVFIIAKKGALSSLWLKPRASRPHLREQTSPASAVRKTRAGAVTHHRQVCGPLQI